MTHEEKVELLIRVDERTGRIEKWCTNHMEHHQKLMLAFLGAAITVVLTLGGTIISLLVALSRDS